jgi:predicted secreted protein
VNIFNDERSERWKKELQGAVNSSNMDNTGSNYISQEIELDAFAFTKYYLEEFENIEVVNKIDKLDFYILEYIKRSKDIL